MRDQVCFAAKHLYSKRLIPLAAALSIFLLAESPVIAQENTGQQSARSTKLTINLERVKQQLAKLPPNNERQPLIRFYVEVYGRAPQINPLRGFDLNAGPVNHGPPTHADMMGQSTPRGFKGPVADLTSLFSWLNNR
ncbi:MAG: hypothetical protein CL484_05555 [Acidobacteria bacterium]|nr:hypothetical protein [Acidobacteriota bacterium]|tara:strand:+ start:2386 stop:2796 length:411 start_codon:yes stop_codon:yes gene_type:complete